MLYVHNVVHRNEKKLSKILVKHVQELYHNYNLLNIEE